MIKAVIFDTGGVVIDVEKLMLQTKEVFQVNDWKQFWQELSIGNLPLCRGEISLHEFWQMLAEKYGKNIDDRVLRELWLRDFDKLTRVNEDVRDIIVELKKNYRVGLISNTIKEHVEINKRLGRFDLFDVVVNSNEVGVTKEDERIFLIALEKTGFRAEECVFIDDVLEFVEAARGVRMKGVLFRDACQLREELRKLRVFI